MQFHIAKTLKLALKRSMTCNGHTSWHTALILCTCRLYFPGVLESVKVMSLLMVLCIKVVLVVLICPASLDIDEQITLVVFA
jgi:hypothetical protein